MKKVLAAVLFLALIGVGTGIYLFYKKPETVEGKTGVVVTAVALSEEFGRDERAANAKYLNQAVEVTGTVSETEQNQEGGLMVILDTGDPMAGVQCAMREKGVQVQKGQQVTIKGFCSGSGITGVSLTDCIVKQ